MAQLALGIAGAAIGSAIGGPLGANIGWMLGAAIGASLDPQKVSGPRLTDPRVHTSSYGGPNPRIYGTWRTPGNCIWKTDLVEHSHTSGGGLFGGPKVTTYTYTVSCAFRVCEGPVTAVLRIWANGKVIWDFEKDVGELPVTVYLGTEDQLPDATIEASEGAGNVPAHRGVCYVVFADWDITEWRTIPNLNFEVLSEGTVTGGIRQIASSEGAYWGASAITAWATDWPTSPVLEGPDATVEVTLAVYDSEVVAGITGPTFRYHYACWIQSAFGVRHDIAAGKNSIMEIGGVDSGVPCPVFASAWVLVQDTPTTHHWAITPFDFPDLADDLWVYGCCSTADGRSFFVFGDPGNVSARPTNWYELRDTSTDAGTETWETVRSGTIILAAGPNYPLGFGQGCISDHLTSLAAENNRRYIWQYTGNVQLNLTPPYGSVIVWEILDNDDLVWSGEQTYGYPIITGTNFPAGDETTFASIFVTETGYAGTIGRRQTALWTRLPSVTGGILLSDIVADLSERAGLDSAEYDVTELIDIVPGYAATQQVSVREMIEPLRIAYGFDAVETDDVIAFRKRARDIAATIEDDDLSAHIDGETMPPLLSVTRQQEVDLPNTVTIDYVAAETDYQTGTQYARRLTRDSESELTLSLPVVLTGGDAKAIADAQLYGAWLERERFVFRTWRRYLALEPTDIVVAHGRPIRITQRRELPTGVLEFEGVAHLGPVWMQPAPGVPPLGFVPVETEDLAATELVLLDIPYASAAYPAGVYYAAMAPSEAGRWHGAALLRSTDGTTYAQVTSTNAADTIGETLGELADYGGGNTLDVLSSVDILIHYGGGALESVTDLELLAGANECKIGDEIVQFRDAELIAASTYRLTRLLRGRRGTEWATGTHTTGDVFVLLPTGIMAAVVSGDYGVERQFKAVTLGALEALADAQAFTNTGNLERPYAPVHLGGGRNAAGDVTLSWQRRARYGGEWLDYVDVPSELLPASVTVNLYEDGTYATLLDSSTVVGDGVTLTAADQTGIWGSPQATVYWGAQAVGSVNLSIEARGAT